MYFVVWFPIVNKLCNAHSKDVVEITLFISTFLMYGDVMVDFAFYATEFRMDVVSSLGNFQFLLSHTLF